MGNTTSDPLPQRYLTDDGPGLGGTIKSVAEDFLVEELPLYEPCGEGEHLYLRVQKRDVPHGELMAMLRRQFGVTEKRIGFAGMKDKRGVTQQTVSVHLHQDPPSLEIPHERIEVLWAERHTNKLRTGHLVGNRFVIRIRDVDPLRAPWVLKQLRRLEREGLPNYFGSQRFGYRRNTHLLGAGLLTGNWQGLLDELLGTTGSPFPEVQRERRELYEECRFGDALVRWGGGDQAERSILRALQRGANATGACRALSKTTRRFYVNAFQSAVFNTLVDRRLEEQSLDTLLEGDLAWKHDGRSVFAVTPEELATDLLGPRLKTMEISPSGPLWGPGMTTASGAIGEAELAALNAAGVDEATMAASAYRCKGARRPMRERLTAPDVDSGMDENGPYIRVAFELPRGTYATVVLRELMRKESDES